MQDIPNDSLVFKWLPRVYPKELGTISKSMASRLKENDKQVGKKMFMKVHKASLKAPFGPIDISAWYTFWDERRTQVNDDPYGWPTDLIISPEFKIDWDLCGHFSMGPPVPEGTPPR